MSQPVRRQPRPTFVALEEGEWDSGICDCCENKKECCFAFWCCPCFACKTSKRFGHCLCLPLLDIFSCCHPITMSMRVSVRHRYNIKGSLCNDWLCSTFCAPCVWCQMSREVKDLQLPTVFSDIFNS